MSELVADPRMAVTLAAAAGAAVFALALVVGELASDRKHMRSNLQHIDDLYDLADAVEPDPLFAPLRERLVQPARTALLRIARRLSPGDYTSRVRANLARAGKLDAAEVDRFLVVRVLTMLASPVSFVVLLKTVPLPTTQAFLVAAIGAAAVVALPRARLDRAVGDREELIRRQLPGLLDLLVVCSEAGLGFGSALARTIASVPGELSQEFAIALGEMRAGSSRADALVRLAERAQLPEIKSFVGALRQADQLGVSIAPVLREQAADMRIRRRMAAQERAQKAPVKMLVPMVFCIFPPLFMVTIGPAGLQLMHGGL